MWLRRGRARDPLGTRPTGTGSIGIIYTQMKRIPFAVKTDLAQPLLLAPGCKLTYLYTFSLLSQLIRKDSGLEFLNAVGFHLLSPVAWAVWGGDGYIRPCCTALKSPERGSRLIC